jgi:hypothetical protein
MRRAEFEAVVIAAVDTVRSGVRLEDDRFELKRSWPTRDKARQLAGGANRANGEDLIYIIGIDETDGSLHSVADVEPADWWAQMKSAFDDVAPDLEIHMTVAIGDNESVVGLLFATDQAPYAVKVTGRDPIIREVPMREGTGTRSTYRRELLRLLLPSIRTPQLTLVGATLTLRAAHRPSGEDPYLMMSLRSAVYFEYVQQQPLFFPSHSSRAILSGGGASWETDMFLITGSRASADIQPFRPNVLGDGLQLAGPGLVQVSALWKTPLEDLSLMAGTEEWVTRLVFPIAGSARIAALVTRFDHRHQVVDVVPSITPNSSYDWMPDLGLSIEPPDNEA